MADVTRRSILAGSGLVIAAAALPTAQAKALPAASLLTLPVNLYRATGNAKEGLGGWAYFLILQTSVDEEIQPLDLTLSYRSNGAVVREERIGAAALAAVGRKGLPPALLTGEAPAPPLFWPHAFRIVSYLPQKPEIDTIEAILRISRNGVSENIEARFPVGTYQQKADLVFPFRGEGLFTQTGLWSGGHRNRSGQFALDVLGLTPTYAPMLRTVADSDERLQDHAGWGRPIIAPAAGTVVIARGDRPDQPKPGTSDPAFFAPEHPEGGDPGNMVVIDHGASEFSMIAHMQAGSVRVKAGDRVTQGQDIGRLGNSGDTSGPHLHYQLQNGPRWENADALPVRFRNVETPERGAFFRAG